MEALVQMGMRKTVSLSLAGMALWCLGGADAGDDRVGITLVNDDSDDLLVSLYDLNTSPPSQLLSHLKVMGNASVPISVTSDAEGRGHVVWRAITADPSLQRCDRRDKVRLAGEKAIHVFARSDCPKR